MLLPPLSACQEPRTIFRKHNLCPFLPLPSDDDPGYDIYNFSWFLILRTHIMAINANPKKHLLR